MFTEAYLLASLLSLVNGQKVDCYPAKIFLHPGQDRQTVVITRTGDSGVTAEVQKGVKFTTVPPGLVEVKEGIAFARNNGVGKLVVELDGKTIEIPCVVKGMDQPAPPVSYSRDVLPILTRAGCNAGKCHGAAAGKDGFRLSLFGFDPEGDLFRLVEEIPNRRVNLADPAGSLLITKALGEVPHTGGKKIEKGSEFHQLLVRWIAEGGKNDSAGLAKPVAIHVGPPALVLEAGAQKHRIGVTADYSDGTTRDVTHLCAFYSSNDGAATVGHSGEISPVQRGEAFILARFATLTGGSSVIVRPANSQFRFPPVQANNYIDELVHSRLARLHIAPSELCSDAEFLRRLAIDLVGKLPEPDEITAFESDKDPQKRAKIVDRLVNRPEFQDIWIMRFAEMLQIRTANGTSPKGIGRYHDWLRSRVQAGASIDQVIREVLTATGGTFEKPAANYYQTETTPATLAENVAQVFCGMRIQCAQCHNHPFDRWTMDDYYGFTAFFAQVGYKQAADPREITIFNRGEGEIEHPLGNKAVTPRYLGDKDLSPGNTDRRELLATWLTSRDNPFLSRNLANVIWSHFLGKGIVEPVDDVRISNPPSNPELLDALGAKLANYRFDVRKLAIDICNSRTYQLSGVKNQSNKLDSSNFASAAVRRVRAEVLLDCISQVTLANTKFPGRPDGSRAVELLDGRSTNHFLTTFGRSTRETPCACEVKLEPTLSQALHLLNGENTTGKINQGGRVKKALQAGKKPRAVADELYIACLARRPSAGESAKIDEMLSKSKNIPEDLEDLFWALLNSREFIFNH